jgi:hypothetical protein
MHAPIPSRPYLHHMGRSGVPWINLEMSCHSSRRPFSLAGFLQTDDKRHRPRYYAACGGDYSWIHHLALLARERLASTLF